MKIIPLLLSAIIIISGGFLLSASPIEAFFYCQDNNTLVENTSININGTWLNLTNPEFCGLNLCDNITLSCDPPAYQQPFIFVGIILGLLSFILIIRLVLKRFLDNF